MTALGASKIVAPTSSNHRRVSAVASRLTSPASLYQSLRQSKGGLGSGSVRARPPARFDVPRAAVNREQAAASASRNYSREVSQLLPTNFDLDLDLSIAGCLSSCLDPDKLAAKSGNQLSKLWSESGSLARVKLAATPLAARQADSQHILQCGLFCIELVNVYQPLRSGGQHADFYALACLCLKVGDVQKTGCTLHNPSASSPCHMLILSCHTLIPQLCTNAPQRAWLLPADQNLKGWVCGTILCR